MSKKILSEEQFKDKLIKIYNEEKHSLIKEKIQMYVEKRKSSVNEEVQDSLTTLKNLFGGKK
jgi:CRISPR/Cas system-associated protein Cas5 (RAMP superfamily)